MSFFLNKYKMTGLFYRYLGSIIECNLDHDNNHNINQNCHCYLNDFKIKRKNGFEYLSNHNKYLIVSLIKYFKSKDNNKEWDSSYQAISKIDHKFSYLLQYSKINRSHVNSLLLSKYNPKQYLEHIIKNSFGIHLIKPDLISENCFKIDLKYLTDYNIDPKYLHYGLTIKLNSDYSLKSIELPAFTHDIIKHRSNKLILENKTLKRYSDMKYHYQKMIDNQMYHLAISSIFLHVFLKNNILENNIYIPGVFLLNYYKYCTDIHPELNGVLAPFLNNIAKTNSSIMDIIVRKNNILDRLFSIKHPEIKKYIKTQKMNLDLPLPHKLVDCDLKDDLMEYWDVFQDFSYRLGHYLETKYDAFNQYPNTEIFISEIEKTFKLSISISRNEKVWERFGRIFTILIYVKTVWKYLINQSLDGLNHPTLIHTKISRKKPERELVTKREFLNNSITSFFFISFNNQKLINQTWSNNSQDKYIKGTWNKLQHDLKKIKIKNCKMNPEYIYI